MDVLRLLFDYLLYFVDRNLRTIDKTQTFLTAVVSHLIPRSPLHMLQANCNSQDNSQDAYRAT